MKYMYRKEIQKRELIKCKSLSFKIYAIMVILTNSSKFNSFRQLLSVKE